MFSVREKDNKYFYFLLVITIICSLFYISNEYIYSKKEYTYTNTESRFYQNLENDQTISIKSSKYPAIATISFSNFYTFDYSRLYDIKTANIFENNSLQTEKNITNDYQNWKGTYNWTKPYTSLPTPFLANQGSYDLTNITDYMGHENCLNLRENSSSLTSIKTQTLGMTNNFSVEFWVNIEYNTDSTFLFLFRLWKTGWTDYTNIYIYKNTQIKVHYGNEQYYTCSLAYEPSQWLKVCVEGDTQKRYVYLNDSLEFSYNTSQPVNEAYFFHGDNQIANYYIDSIKLPLLNYIRGIYNNHIDSYVTYTYTLNESVRYIYEIDIEFQSEYLKIFNYNNSEYEVFDKSNSDFYLLNNSLLFYYIEHDSVVDEIEYELEIVVLYFESDFYDLVTYIEFEEVSIKINGTLILANPLIFNLTSDTILDIDIDIEAIYSIIVIIQYNITEVVGI